jgi:hypothetical protein
VTKRKTETVNDLSRCLEPLYMDATLIAVIEMSQSSWLVAGIIPGVERQPLKKLAMDEHALLKLLSRWRADAEKKGYRIACIAVAFETGHDGFWLARWLALCIESRVIHASSVAVTREHRRAKTDRLDTELLKRGKRDLERHRIVKQQIRDIERTRLERLDKAPAEGPHAMHGAAVGPRDRHRGRNG